MSIARRAILGLAVALLIAGVASRLPASNDAPRERLEAELKVVRTTIENGSVEIEAKVLVRNHFEGALRNVTAVVDTAINMEIAPRQVAVGEVPLCGSAIASQHVTLRYEAPGQDSPNRSEDHMEVRVRRTGERRWGCPVSIFPRKFSRATRISSINGG